MRTLRLLMLLAFSTHFGLAQAVSMNEKLRQIEESQAEMRRKMGAPGTASPPPANRPAPSSNPPPSNYPAPPAGNTSTAGGAGNYPAAGGAANRGQQASHQNASGQQASSAAFRLGDFSVTTLGCSRMPALVNSVQCSFLAENVTATARPLRIRQIMLINDQKKQFQFIPTDLQAGVSVNPSDSALFSAQVPTGFSMNQVRVVLIANQAGSVIFENLAINAPRESAPVASNPVGNSNPPSVAANRPTSVISSNQIGNAQLARADIGLDFYPGASIKQGTASKFNRDNKDMVFVVLETTDDLQAVVNFYRAQMVTAANSRPLTDISPNPSSAFLGFTNGNQQQDLTVLISKALKTTEVTITSSKLAGRLN